MTNIIILVLQYKILCSSLHTAQVLSYMIATCHVVKAIPSLLYVCVVWSIHSLLNAEFIRCTCTTGSASACIIEQLKAWGTVDHIYQQSLEYAQLAPSVYRMTFFHWMVQNIKILEKFYLTLFLLSNADKCMYIMTAEA